MPGRLAVSLLIGTLICSRLSRAAVQDGNGAPIQLLVSLPLPPSHTDGSTTAARWERGPEILPAAHIAVERINQEPTILPGYQLELVEMDSGACTDNALKMRDALFNFYSRIVEEDNTVLGVLGLFCTALTQLISPLAGREEIGILQISASPSPFLRDSLQDYPLLHFTLPSSAAYYNAMLRMMQEFDWRRVFIIAGTPGTHYFHTAESFHQALATEDNFTATFSYNNPNTLRDLRQSGFRIVFASVDAQQAATLICQAHKEGLTSPLFAWVFYEHSLEDLLALANQTCGVQTMTSALNGSFFLQFPLAQSDPQVTIVSGQTYQEYYREYLDRLNSTTQLQPNLYANVLYDQVWAFALALNGSLATLEEHNISLTELSNFSSKKRVTEVISREISNISFEGASSQMNSMAPIAILRVNSTRSVVLEGVYKQLSESLNISTETVPRDEILRRYNLTDPLVAILLFILIAGSAIMTSAVLILFVYYRNAPEIKASSPKLSLLMFLGCYMVFLSIALDLVLRSTILTGEQVILDVFCNSISMTLNAGHNLLYATLLVRLLRVYRIFSHFGKTGRVCSDGILFLIIVVIVGSGLLVFIVRIPLDPVRLVKFEAFKQSQTDGELPYIQVSQACFAYKGVVWTLVVVTHLFLVLLVIVILAVKTRKIRRENFKDTKKINAFIAYVAVLSALLLPIWFFVAASDRNLSSVVAVLSFGSFAVLCQLLLFVPKVLPPFLRALRQSSSKVISKPANMLTTMTSQITLKRTLSTY